MAELDFDNMSEEELENFVANANSEDIIEDNTEPEPTEPEAEEEPKAEEEPEQEQEQEQEQEEEKPEEELEEDEFTRGKSRKDLLEIIKNGTQKISKQNNEINDYRTKYEQVTSKYTEKLEEKKIPVKDELADLMDKYDPEDLGAIKKIVAATLKSDRDRQAEQAKQERLKSESANEEVWAMVQKTDPSFYQQYSAQIIEEVRKDRNATLAKPGWVLERVLSLKSTPVQKTASKSVVKRPVAKTAGTGSGSSKPSGKGQTKTVEQMDHLEYAEYMKSQGINLLG